METFSQFDARFDTLVMGRKTYDETRALLGDQPFYPGKHKLVFSHRPLVAPDVTVVAAPVVTTIQKLRAQPGGGLWIVGGGAIVTALLAAKLIDELWLQIAPVLLGRGKRLFVPADYQAQFTVVDRTEMGELTELHLRRQVAK